MELQKDRENLKDIRAFAEKEVLRDRKRNPFTGIRM